MLTSLALIFLLGLILSSIFQKLKLPGLIGMILTGILLGPYVLNLLDSKLLLISSDLRQLALVIILTRAGLSLNLEDLKKVGRPAMLMCFVPACFEMVAVIILAPLIFSVSYLEAAIIGSVIAAVSPAVIVPRMLKLIEEGYGKNHSIPQLILASASVDDVFVIVVFTSLVSLAQGGSVNFFQFLQIPISIILGIILGILVGFGSNRIFKTFHIRDSVKVLVLLSFSFLMIELENQLKGIVSISGLIGIMSMGIMIYKSNTELAKRLSSKYNKLWVAAEVLLFVLVGATVDLSYARKAGVIAIFLVLFALVIRMIGVSVCLIRTKLTKKERIFCMMAYSPKATVQAAIGGLPLAYGLACGQKVLTVAVLSILITAPLGAFLVDRFYVKLLSKESTVEDQ